MITLADIHRLFRSDEVERTSIVYATVDEGSPFNRNVTFTPVLRLKDVEDGDTAEVTIAAIVIGALLENTPSMSLVSMRPKTRKIAAPDTLPGRARIPACTDVLIPCS